VVIIAGSALAALGHNPFGGLTSWLGAEPGKPAPPREQAGFATRNAASYASFPQGTRVRILLHASVAGKPFSLLGFRNGPALCLRLARADEPSSLGVNQCVPLRELIRADAPALVASTAYFRVGKRPVDAIFGFADDTTRTIEVRRFRGDRHVARVTSNAFVVLHVPRNTGYDPIVSVRARTRNGRFAFVPFAPAFGVQAPHGVPSYLRRVPARLRGPAKPEAASSGSISWLARREPRGKTFAVAPGFVRYLDGTVVFSRSIQPDPSDPFRMGVSLIRAGRNTQKVLGFLTSRRETRVHPGELLICLSELYPLRGGNVGSLCAESSPSGWPRETGPALTTRFLYREMFSRVSGLVADDVQKLELVLSSGRVIPVPIRDNVYTVEASNGGFPAKLVAYDGSHRALDVQVIPVPYRFAVAPCPRARIAGPVSAAKPYERLDPATGDVNGRPILGRSLDEVEAALGPPDLRGGSTLYYGGARANRAALTISFKGHGRDLRAYELAYNTPDLAVSRLGHVLRLQPAELQRRLASAYGSSYRLDVGYGSEPNRLGCSGSFRARGQHLVLSFGIAPAQSRLRPFLTVGRP
jgi:hypothetical protein